MRVRPLAGALLLSLALAGCGVSTSTSCSSKTDVNPAGSILTDDIQKAESAGKIDRGKAADAMGRVMAAGQAYEKDRDVRAFCAALAKIRKDTGV